MIISPLDRLIGPTVQLILVSGGLTPDTNAGFDIGTSSSLTFKRYFIADGQSGFLNVGGRGLAYSSGNEFWIVGSDNLFPTYYTQRSTSILTDTGSDNTGDSTNLYQGDISYKYISLMYGITGTTSNGVILGDGVTTPCSYFVGAVGILGKRIGFGLNPTTKVGFITGLDQSKAAVQIGIFEFRLNDSSAQEAVRPDTTDKVDLGDIANTLLWRRLYLSQGAHLGASSTSEPSLNMPAGTAPSSPTEGDIWNDSTQKTHMGYFGAVRQSRVGCIFSQTATGTISNSTTETAISSTGVGTLTIPANGLVAGKNIRITARGIWSNQAVPITLRIKVKFGSTVILDTGAQTSPVGSVTNQGWYIQGDITCRTTGATGTVFGQGVFVPNSTAIAEESWDMENTATTTIDTTTSQAITVTAQWGAGVAAADTISCTNLTVEILN